MSAVYDFEYGDGCQDCGGTGAQYEHAPSCRDDDCVGNGDMHSCVRGTWQPCLGCAIRLDIGAVLRVA